MKKRPYPALHGNNDEMEPVKEYYHKLTFRVSVLKYILAAFTIGFILFCFTQYRSEITIENFRYMLKFFDFTTDSASAGGQIALDLDRNFVAKGLRNNIAVADKSGLSIYDYSGKRLFHSSFRTDNTALATSSKYVYAYDIGGNTVKIFNTYSETKSFDYDYPVIGLTNNAAGAFGVITSAPDYKSAVIVYNKEFQQIFTRYFGESYVVSLAINRQGNKVAMLINSVTGGDYLCELLEFDLEQEEPLNKLKFIGEMPLKLQYCYDGTLMILTSKALRMYDTSFNQKNEMFFGENTPSSYYFTDDYAIMTYIVGSVRGTSRVDIYKNDGTLARSVELDEGIVEIVSDKDKAYVLTYTKLYIIDIQNGEGGDSVTEVGTEPSKLVLNGDFLITLSPERATVNRIRTSVEVSEEPEYESE